MKIKYFTTSVAEMYGTNFITQENFKNVVWINRQTTDVKLKNTVAIWKIKYKAAA